MLAKYLVTNYGQDDRITRFSTRYLPTSGGQAVGHHACQESGHQLRTGQQDHQVQYLPTTVGRQLVIMLAKYLVTIYGQDDRITRYSTFLPVMGRQLVVMLAQYHILFS
jgi:hypothetical protein